jgi:hypothetical protein
MVRHHVACFAPCLSFLVAACGDDAAGTDLGRSHETIGAEGGELALPDGATVTVPEGALAEPTKLEVEALPDESAAPLLGRLPTGLEAESKVYAFAPHGLHFESVVEVTLPFHGSSMGMTVQRLADEDDDTWDREHSYADFAETSVSFKTDHFSLYVVARGPLQVMPAHPVQDDAGSH